MPDHHELDKRLALVEQAVIRQSEELKSINGNLSRLVWAVIIALIAAVMNFILKGGLNG